MTRGLVIADDLTGAADTGVMFAKRGLRTVVTWKLDNLPDADVWVYSTESRYLTEKQAYKRTLQAAQYFAAQGVDWVYKKVDSTLRGHPGEELQAVLDAFDSTKTLVAPAFPAQGRTTINGLQYVHGTPLNETVFGTEVTTARMADNFTPAAPNAVLSLDIVRQPPQLHVWFSDNHQHVILADAETNSDLALLVQTGKAHNIRIWCGSAGLAESLSATFTDYLMASPYADPVIDREAGWYGNGVLVVAASQHPMTKAQVSTLSNNATPIITPIEQWFSDETIPVTKVTQQVLEALATSYQAVLTTTHLPLLPGMQARLVTRLAGVIQAITAQHPLTGMILTGGDTAVTVIQALGAQGLILRGEVESGVPWGILTGGCASGMPVITKAGGFGNDQTLVKTIDFLDMLII